MALRALLFAAAMMVVAAPVAAQQPPPTVSQAEQRLRELQGRLPADHLNLAGPYWSLGWAYWRAYRQGPAIEQLRSALRIREARQGPDHPDLALVLTDLSFMLRETGRVSESLGLLQRALPIAERAPNIGPGAPLTGSILFETGRVLTALGRGREGRGFLLRAVAVRQEVVARLQGGGQAQNLPNALSRLAWAQLEAGQNEPAARSMRAAVQAQERAGGEGPELAQHLNDLGHFIRDLAPAESLALLRRALAINERLRGANDPAVATNLQNLAWTMQRIGRYREVETLARRALQIRQRVFGADSQQVAFTLEALGRAELENGKYAEAEQTLLRAIQILERRYGGQSVQVSEALRILALAYGQGGRPAEAEPLLRRALAIRERIYGQDNLFVASFLNDLGYNMILQGRYQEAIVPLQRAVRIQEANDPNSSQLAIQLTNLARAMFSLERGGLVEPIARRALAIREALNGANSIPTAGSLGLVGRILTELGHGAEAEPLIRRAIAIRRELLGDDHPSLGFDLRALSIALISQRRLDESFESVRQAARLIARRAQVRAGEAEDGGVTSERLQYREVFTEYVALAYQVLQRGDNPDILTEAFEMAQQAQGGGTAVALARMADRFAAGDGALADALRRRGDLSERLAQADRELRAALGGSTAPERAEALRLRQEIAQLRRQGVDLDRAIVRDFPAYERLVSGTSATLADVQRTLGPDEAVINYLFTRRAVFMFVIRADRAAVFREALGRADADAAVRRLRQGLDPATATSLEALPVVDFEIAHRLYRMLIAPAAAMMDGVRNVIVVPDAALQSLPFAVLLTAPTPPPQRPDDFAAYRAAPWLAHAFATTVVPSASALVALRERARASRASEPFIGFGDPVLSGPQGQNRSVNAAGLFLRSGGVDVRAIAQLSPLPDTADELRALARMLQAPDSNLYLRERATERQVRAANLGRYRVLAFATHGLTGGELPGFAEPGLILTPPAQASRDDDGILTASEIAALSLDADWVILSACNTAAADGSPGAEALSGLARAFFYAGSRTLLVSHWSVESVAARRLTTGMFDAVARDPAIGRAEALRRSMLALMAGEGEAHFAHPILWAPFIVVGEGGRGG